MVLDIQRQPGANVIDVVAQIRRELPRLQAAVPAGVTLSVVERPDRDHPLVRARRAVHAGAGLSFSWCWSCCCSCARGAPRIIAGVTLPLSLVASFGVMWFAGFSLDNLSLMALTIGTGFVVDDVIVMIENITRHIEDGETPMQAALHGAGEIGFTIVSLTLSLVAVFIPLLFMSGLVGRMFREFSLTLTIAVVTSAIVSLTLTPMMCSRLVAFDQI